MMLNAESIARLLSAGQNNNDDDPLVITPCLGLDDLEGTPSASIDLRLGTWFAAPQPARTTSLDPVSRRSENKTLSALTTKSTFVPFGHAYILHPQSFVLGVTLEWIRLPRSLGGYVTAKSSWGRRGLIIATATGVHPSFCGCLTLELSNVGEVPISIRPGMQICQLFLHTVKTSAEAITVKQGSTHSGKRKPLLSDVKDDRISEILSSANGSVSELNKMARAVAKFKHGEPSHIVFVERANDGITS